MNIREVCTWREHQWRVPHGPCFPLFKRCCFATPVVTSAVLVPWSKLTQRKKKQNKQKKQNKNPNVVHTYKLTIRSHHTCLVNSSWPPLSRSQLRSRRLSHSICNRKSEEKLSQWRGNELVVLRIMCTEVIAQLMLDSSLFWITSENSARFPQWPRLFFDDKKFQALRGVGESVNSKKHTHTHTLYLIYIYWLFGSLDNNRDAMLFYCNEFINSMFASRRILHECTWHDVRNPL